MIVIVVWIVVISIGGEEILGRVMVKIYWNFSVLGEVIGEYEGN